MPSFADIFYSDFFSDNKQNRIPRALTPRPSVERVRGQNAPGQRDVKLRPRLGL